jgi:hypothetical protein
MVNMIARAHKGRAIIINPIADTIIKLDSTDKYPRLTKGRKTKAKTPAKKVNANDTTKNLEAELKATAVDSTTYPAKDIIRYYGKARVTYTDFELDADFIEVNKATHLVFARGSIDPKTKRYIGRPISKQGEDKPITSDSLIFNYDTKKGKIFNVLTQQETNYISHGQAKKLNEDEVGYDHIIFSACDKPDPDYGIVITRGIGEKKRIISGPAYLEIEGVPIPIGIPFGFFPKPDTRSSGLILPTFGEDATLGFYIRDLGYYIGLSDYADLTNLGTYYSNGSYEVSSTLDYMKRYKYNGNLALSYGSHNYGLQGDPPAKDFHISWSHSQNPASSPGRTFSASVNAGTSSFYQNNPATVGYNLQSLTQNALRSTISYSRTWEGTPFNLTMGVSHSQDLTRKTVTLEPLNFNFSMATISPFDRKDRVGEQKWYQKLTVGYTLAGTNKLTDIPENELFKSNTISKKLLSGFDHQIPVSLGLNILKYFQFNTSFNYHERWYMQTIRQRFARADSLVTDTVPGFQRVGDYSLSAGFSTKLYGTVNFKSGKVMAIRHVITPNVGFNYRPDYSGLDRSYNRAIVSNATIPYPVVSQRYSIFDRALYGGPGGGTQAGISLSVDNTVEAKIRPGIKDTSQTPRKVQLIQGLSFATFYNFAADSFKLSPVTFSGHTALFHDKLNISFGGTFNPYAARIMDSIASNQIIRYATYINKYSWQEGKWPMLTSFNLSASASLNAASFNPRPAGLQQVGANLQNISPEQAQKLALLNADPSAYIDFNVPWNISLNYSFTYNNSLTSTQTANTLMISGDVNITSKWKVQYNTNVDLKIRQISSATSFAIYRDLHCWDLSIQWLPFGYYKSYNVTLRVKSAVLQALKLSKRSDYTSNGYFNR